MNSEGSNNSGTILVVDDEPEIRNVLDDILKDMGFKVIPVGSGEAALAIYSKVKPDLIITDIMMPGISGLEFVQNIRRHDQITPIIIVTGLQTTEASIKAATLGVDDFIMKPFYIGQVTSSVERLINLSSTKRENNRLKILVSELTRENRILNERLEEQKNKVATNVDTDQDKTFYRSLAHDMKNEFATLGGGLRFIRQEGADLPSIQETCDILERSFSYLYQLIRRMSDYTEIGESSSEAIDILELVKKVESLIRPRIPSNIQLEVIAESDNLKGKVFVDADQVIGGVAEVVNNAVYALRNTEGVIKINFDIRDGKLIIAISNNGPIVPEGIRERLFKKYVRSSKEKGTGMGLFLLSNILTKWGGEISLQESSATWTTFTIQLPLYEHQKDE